MGGKHAIDARRSLLTTASDALASGANQEIEHDSHERQEDEREQPGERRRRLAALCQQQHDNRAHVNHDQRGTDQRLGKQTSALERHQPAGSPSMAFSSSEIVSR